MSLVRNVLSGIALGFAVPTGVAICWVVLWVGAQLAAAVVAPATYGDVHGKLEAASFLSSISLPLVAIIAGYIAYRQLAEAKDARVASLYLQITENFKTEALREARRNLYKLSCAHKASGTAMDLGEYVDQVLDVLRARPLHDPGFQLYVSCMQVMEFWEEVGVLGRRNLVDCKILLDYMADNVHWADTCFTPFVRRRQLEKGPELYANALWLIDEARVAKAYRHRSS